MHADTLYQRMLNQEKEIALAKTEGREAPKFPPLLSDKFKFIPRKEDGGLEVTDLKPHIQAGFKKRLEGLTPEEREVEENTIRSEIRVGEELAKNLGSLFGKQERERQERKVAGTPTFGDRFVSVFRLGGMEPGDEKKEEKPGKETPK